MTKFYSIAISNVTAEEERTLAEAWASYGWWHAVPNFWLVKDPMNLTTAAGLRDQILRIAPTARTMVVEIRPETWAGSSMDPSNRDWLRQFWPPEAL
jgi:hypothetical protein